MNLYSIDEDKVALHRGHLIMDSALWHFPELRPMLLLIIILTSKTGCNQLSNRFQPVMVATSWTTDGTPMEN